MKTRVLLVVAVGLLAAVAVGEARWVAHQRVELDALRRRTAELASEGAALDREREKNAADLSEARQQLAALPARADAAAAVPHAAETKAWLARMKQLRGLFDARPREKIPEMRWLTDEDWLRVARRCDLSSDEGVRKALADLRGAAIDRFTPLITEALRKFARTATADTPTDIRALGAFFGSGVDPAVLERYSLARSAESASFGPGWIVQNTAPLDPAYDWCYRVRISSRGSYGVESGTGPWAWIPDLSERYERATADYRRAHQDRLPTDISDVVPLIVPPLAPEVAAKLIEDAKKGWQ